MPLPVIQFLGALPQEKHVSGKHINRNRKHSRTVWWSWAKNSRTKSWYSRQRRYSFRTAQQVSFQSACKAGEKKKKKQLCLHNIRKRRKLFFFYLFAKMRSEARFCRISAEASWWHQSGCRWYCGENTTESRFQPRFQCRRCVDNIKCTYMSAPQGCVVRVLSRKGALHHTDYWTCVK